MASSYDNKILALNYLKEQIITCAMPPGSAINVNEIAARLNISKTPVREALLELQYENYITVIPRKKTIVSRISLKDLEYVYDARSLVEIHIIRGISPEDVKGTGRPWSVCGKNGWSFPPLNRRKPPTANFCRRIFNSIRP